MRERESEAPREILLLSLVTIHSNNLDSSHYASKPEHPSLVTKIEIEILMAKRPIPKGKPSIQRACPMLLQKSSWLERESKATFRKIVAAVSRSNVVELTLPGGKNRVLGFGYRKSSMKRNNSGGVEAKPKRLWRIHYNGE